MFHWRYPLFYPSFVIPAGRKIPAPLNFAIGSTLYNFPVKAIRLLNNNIGIEHKSLDVYGNSHVGVEDARSTKYQADIWCTDPPYADAINYHELSEFFLAWYEKHLPRLFSEWYADSKRSLAIRGSGKDFREGMVDAYRNLAAHMPDNGLQIVMFTHQTPVSGRAWR